MFTLNIVINLAVASVRLKFLVRFPSFMFSCRSESKNTVVLFSVCYEENTEKSA